MRKKRSSPRLSKRLEMAARLLSPCGTVADVGCDHAFLCICLVLEGKAERAIAMDVREGPIGHAKENISLYNCSQAIETRLSDGLDALAPGEAENIVMTGMGGVLMTELLERGRDRLTGVREMVLSPQSHPELVRSYLQDAGYVIEAEDVCFDGGKYYAAMRAVRKTSAGSGPRGMPDALRAFVEKVASRVGREDDGAVQIDAILERECSLEEEARLRYGDALMYKGNEVYLELLLYERKKAERVLGSLKASGAEPEGGERERFTRRLEVLDCAIRSCEALKEV
ncbi:MAG: SAM-dependent methyltransferase [Lachnospiraceae bacterium]|nr:SAM-dependent methyltransferase [Lachnospiraceae bacterium]